MKNEPNVIEEIISKDENKVVTKKYRIISTLGKGGFGICYKVQDPDTKEFHAIKVLSKYFIKEKNYVKKLNEVKRIQDQFKNIPNIVELKKVFEDEINVYVILELCDNGDLLSILQKRKKLTEIEVQYYISNLINALIRMHQKKIVHLDLKPENIFLTEYMELKLGDFGLATNIGDNNHDNVPGGTTNYMPPEAISQKKYSYGNDIWAVGIIMYYLIIGKLPFNQKDDNKTKEKIKALEYEFPDDVLISNAAKDLIQQILVPPEKRPSLNKILTHDFFDLGRKIPKRIPTKFIVETPSLDYIKYFMPDADKNGIVNRKKIDHQNLKLEEEEEEKKKEAIRKEQREKPVYVTKFVDYSGKYGLGYKLSNNNYGACFNDSSKIIYEPNNEYFTIIEKKDNGKDLLKKNYFVNKKAAFSHDISKKYILLKNFIKKLSNEKEDTYANLENIEKEKKEFSEEKKEFSEEENIDEQMEYVKRYRIYDKYSILFVFYNNDIQILFKNDMHENYENILILYQRNEIIHMVYNFNNNIYQSKIYSRESIHEIKNFDFQRKMRYVNNLFENMKVEVK